MSSSGSLVKYRLDQLKGMKDAMFGKCDDCASGMVCHCEMEFAEQMRYLKHGVPLKSVKHHIKYGGALEERTALEYDPVEEEFSKPFDFVEEKLEPAIDRLGKYIHSGYNMLLYGFNGSGKTFAANSMLCHALQDGYTGYYIFFRELYNLYNTVEFKEHEPFQKETLDYVINCSYLVIDELGKEKISEPMIAFLEYAIKTRLEANLCTTVVTNLNLRDKGNPIKTRYGNSVWDCFRQYFIFQLSKSGDFRAKTRPKWQL